jgi:hypothetical protein
MIDLDPKIAAVLDEHAPLLNETGDWNQVLADAGVVEHRSRTSEKPRRYGSKRVRAFVLAVVVAVAASLTGVAVLGGGSSILDRAGAAISVSRHQVLHERIVLTATGGGVLGTNRLVSIELWIQGAEPHQYRLLFNGPAVDPRVIVGPPAHYEQGGTLDSRSPRIEVYDPRTNTIRRTQAGPSGTLTFDPATAIRSALASGHAHGEGKRTVNGKPVIVIQLNSLVNDSTGWGVRAGGKGTATVLVNPRTYTPVQIAFHHVDGVSANLGIPFFHRGSDWAQTSMTMIERFTAFEQLPATTANLRLASLSAQHPTARRVTVSPGSLYGG